MAGEATRFQPGQSGNPAGKPKGARNRTTLAIEALIDGAADDIANYTETFAGDTCDGEISLRWLSLRGRA